MADRCCTSLLYGTARGHHRRWMMAPELVGVAGFEPTASSSRTRSGPLRQLAVWLFLLVGVLAGVGLRRRGELSLYKIVSQTSPTGSCACGGVAATV
jgi:hypothetical protein